MTTLRLPQRLIDGDLQVWRYLHTEWRNAFLDAVVPYLRNQWTWAPLYLFLLLFMVGNFKKKGWLWCLFFLGTFALADQISAHWLKEVFQRARPCNDLSLAGKIHIIVPCGSGYSFPSSHAANHFALAFFMLTTLRFGIKWISWAVVIWALLVSYAQVYVGVHFPLDVFCGALIGMMIGYTTGNLFNFKFRLTLPASVQQ